MRIETPQTDLRPSVLDSVATENTRKHHRLDPEAIRQLRCALCKHFRDDEWIRERFPWAERLSLHSLEFHERFDSQIDGATKLVLKTSKGLLIETVILRIDTGRVTLCLSSQVGCAAACEFCATGKMGVAINLSAVEILDQVVLAGQLLAKEGQKIRNLVLMGMGEPFHNEANVFTALSQLQSKEYFYHPPKRILVSTVGIADGMLRCAEEFSQVGLALSLHSVQQDVRERIIPLATKYPLNDLRRTIKTLNQIQTNPVMIEYLMLDDINDSMEDAALLVDWLEGLRVHVNLIPFNPISGSNLLGSPPSTVEHFSNLLKSAGLKTTTRYSLGQDIGAACGQLIEEKNRQFARKLSLKRHG